MVPPPAKGRSAPKIRTLTNPDGSKYVKYETTEEDGSISTVIEEVDVNGHTRVAQSFHRVVNKDGSVTVLREIYNRDDTTTVSVEEYKDANDEKPKIASIVRSTKVTTNSIPLSANGGKLAIADDNVKDEGQSPTMERSSKKQSTPKKETKSATSEKPSPSSSRSQKPRPFIPGTKIPEPQTPKKSMKGPPQFIPGTKIPNPKYLSSDGESSSSMGMFDVEQFFPSNEDFDGRRKDHIQRKQITSTSLEALLKKKAEVIHPYYDPVPVDLTEATDPSKMEGMIEHNYRSLEAYIARNKKSLKEIKVTKTSNTNRAGITVTAKKGQLTVTKIRSDSLFSETDLKVGDVIISINKFSFWKLPNPKHAFEIVRNTKDNITVLARSPESS